MIADLQPGEEVVAERIDRISRLSLAEAEQLVAALRVAGVRLAVPGVVDLEELVAGSEGVARTVLEAVQDMLLRLIIALCEAGMSIARTADLAGCSPAQIKQVTALHRAARCDPPRSDARAAREPATTRARLRHDHACRGATAR